MFYLAYHQSCDLDWNDEVYVRWLPYGLSTDDVRDIPARKVPSKKRIVGDVQVKKCVGIVTFMFKPEIGKTHEEAAHAVYFELSSLADFSDPDDVMPISEKGIVE